MSEQDGVQSSTKHRQSRKTSTVHQQDGQQTPAVQRPANDDKEEWKAYWKIQGQQWRREQEIDPERQRFLAERRAISPDTKQGIYPFKDVKLNRADVEWLLTTHEKGYGPIIWSYESQQVKVRDGLDLRGADLRQVDLHGLPLARMLGGLILDEWSSSTSEQRNIAGVLMQGANLKRVHLEGASLRAAHLEGADLFRAHLEKSHLTEAHLEKTSLAESYLEKTSLGNAILNDEKHIGPRLVDVHWGDTNLAVIEWSQVKMLDDEYKARQKTTHRGIKKDPTMQLEEYRTAVRANRQLAVVLRDQGLNEEADHFAYRAQLLQQVVLRRQRKFGRYLFFGFLDLLAGYGYRPGRSVFWYLAIVCGFALAYHLLGQLSLFPPDAFVYSLTSFHGRGFFPGLEHRTSLHDPLIMLAAIEAVVGLFIEISFIATFTQRFFGR